MEFAAAFDGAPGEGNLKHPGHLETVQPTELKAEVRRSQRRDLKFSKFVPNINVTTAKTRTEAYFRGNLTIERVLWQEPPKFKSSNFGG